jgi:Ca2+-binding RTX toxin-like protein
MAVAAGMVALIGSPPAHAAIVARLDLTAGYIALPGETNNVVVTMQDGAPVFSDRGGGVFLVGPGCTATGPREARCAGARTLHFDLGDGDDSLIVDSSLPVVANGGDGNDVLVTGTAADSVSGGGGDDVLDGSGGGDLLDGGPGRDTVDYRSRTAPVVVTLDGVANDGEHAEYDNVVATENVLGGQGPDVLVGDAGDNVLSGGDGNDAIAGGGGNDTLIGGPGQDGINADDPVPSPDIVGCGSQRDRVFGDVQDTIRSDCESIDRSGTLGYAASVGAGPDPPVLGKSVVVRPVSGVVLVVPETSADPNAAQPVPAAPPVPLDSERNIPIGSVVDTRLGTVAMTTAIDHEGTTQSGDFDSGAFQIFQGDLDGSPADLALRGGKSFAACSAGDRRRGLAVFSSRHRGQGGGAIRRLWGDAHGKFRTGGRLASATVRGTRWLTEDRCDGTLVRVARGEVVVHDAVANRDVVVRAGEQYLARATR